MRSPSIRSIRPRGAALFALSAVVGATSTSAETMTAQPLDAKDAPAYVSACAIDTAPGGVFTPAITVADRKASAVVSADVAIYFIDPQNRLVGEVVVSPPYGPTASPFGTVDRVACRVKRAQFVDGSVFELNEAPRGASSVLPAVATVLGAGAAALLLSNHGSNSSSGTTPVPVGPSSAIPSTPVPVATITELLRPKLKPKP
jgi:hypothetical protein